MHRSDPLQRFFYRLMPTLRYVIDNKRNFILGGVIVACVVGVVSGYVYYRQSLNHQAQILWSQALELENEQESGALYQQIIEEYENSPSAHFARLALAKMAYTKNDYATVVTVLEPVTKAGTKQAMLRIMARHNIAAAYEAQDKWEEAIRYYQMAVVDSANQTQDLSRYHLGRAYEQLGELEKARDFYQEVHDDTKNQGLKEMALTRLIFLAKKS
jgi:predicted negative regulator of RcsB-dependent stress response